MNDSEQEDENLDEVMRTLQDMITQADDHIKELQRISQKRQEAKNGR